MSTLMKIQDENRESKFGYVYAVSGPGMYQTKKHHTRIFIWRIFDAK